MQGIVKVQNGHAAGGETVWWIVHRSELRGVVLKDNTVSWVLASMPGDHFEVDFYKGDDKAPDIAAMFFTELTSESDDEVMWENSEESERWFRNGEEVKL